VGGLPYDIKMSELRDVFGEFGKVLVISIKQRYAFIEYEDYHSAREAIAKLDGTKVWDNERIKVEQTVGTGDRTR